MAVSNHGESLQSRTSEATPLADRVVCVASLWPIASEPQAAEDATQQSEQQQLIKRALASLPSQLQTILVLRYFNGVNSKEIGEILELPDSTVRSHLRRAREKLAVALKRAGLGDE